MTKTMTKNAPKQQSYERDWTWNGFKIHAARTGWVVEYWNRTQGSTTGRKILIPYSTSYPRKKECDLYEIVNNNGGTLGDILAEFGPFTSWVRTLRCGEKVR